MSSFAEVSQEEDGRSEARTEQIRKDREETNEGRAGGDRRATEGELFR